MTDLTSFNNSTCTSLCMGIRGGMCSLPEETPLCSLGCCLGFSSLASATPGYLWPSVNYLWVSLLILEGDMPCGGPQEMTKTCCNSRTTAVSKLQVADTIWRWDANRNYYLCVHCGIYHRDKKKIMINGNYYFYYSQVLVWTSNSTGSLQESHKCLTGGLLWKGIRGLSSEVAKCRRTCLEHLSYWRCQHKGEKFSLKSLVKKQPWPGVQEWFLCEMTRRGWGVPDPTTPATTWKR